MNVFEQIRVAETKDELRELHKEWFGNERVRAAIYRRWSELEEIERTVRRLEGVGR